MKTNQFENPVITSVMWKRNNCSYALLNLMMVWLYTNNTYDVYLSKLLFMMANILVACSDHIALIFVKLYSQFCICGDFCNMYSNVLVVMPCDCCPYQYTIKPVICIYILWSEQSVALGQKFVDSRYSWDV